MSSWLLLTRLLYFKGLEASWLNREAEHTGLDPDLLSRLRSEYTLTYMRI
jgi:hypothetical protein